MQLLERMKQAGKSWSLYVFLVGQCDSQVHHGGTGAAWESPGSGWGWNRRTRPTPSCKNADTRALAAELRQHGIKLLGSTIVGLEHHTPENIRAGDRVRRLPRHRLPPVHAVHAGTRARRCSQQMQPEGRMLDDVDLADIHGQFKFNFQHAAISRDAVEAISRLGLSLRLRAQWPQPVSHLRNHLSGLEALSQLDPDLRVRERMTLRSHQAAHHLQRRAVGDGEAA